MYGGKQTAAQGSWVGERRNPDNSLKNHDEESWIQVDLGKMFNVTAVQTQGRNGISMWIDKFTIQYGTSQSEWKLYKDRNGATKVIIFS